MQKEHVLVGLLSTVSFKKPAHSRGSKSIAFKN